MVELDQVRPREGRQRPALGEPPGALIRDCRPDPQRSQINRPLGQFRHPVNPVSKPELHLAKFSWVLLFFASFASWRELCHAGKLESRKDLREMAILLILLILSQIPNCTWHQRCRQFKVIRIWIRNQKSEIRHGTRKNEK